MITYCEKEEKIERSKNLLSKSKKIKKQKTEESEETARRVQKKIKKSTSSKKGEARVGGNFDSDTQSLRSLATELSSGGVTRGSVGASAHHSSCSDKRIEFEPFVNIEFFPSNLQDILKTNASKNSEKIISKIAKLKTPSAGAFPNRIRKMRFLVEAQERILEKCLLNVQSKPSSKALDNYNFMRSSLRNIFPVPSQREVATPDQGNQSTLTSASSQKTEEVLPLQVKSVGDISIDIEENYDFQVKNMKASCCNSTSDEEYYVVSPAKTEASLNDCYSQDLIRGEENYDSKRMNIIDRLLMNPNMKNTAFSQGALVLERKISESLSNNRKRILSSSKVEDITDLLTEVISKSEEEDSLGMEEQNDIWNNYREDDACSAESLSEVQTPLNSFPQFSCHYYTPQQPLQNFYNHGNNLIATYTKTYDFDSFMLDNDLPHHSCY